MQATRVCDRSIFTVTMIHSPLPEQQRTVPVATGVRATYLDVMKRYAPFLLLFCRRWFFISPLAIVRLVPPVAVF